MRTSLYIAMTIGSVVGGYIPMLWGADMFSMWSILGSGIGAIAAIFVMYKINNL